jgi:hypothetical protein
MALFLFAMPAISTWRHRNKGQLAPAGAAR